MGETVSRAVVTLYLCARWDGVQQPVIFHCQHVRAFNKFTVKGFSGQPTRPLKGSDTLTEKGI